MKQAIYFILIGLVIYALSGVAWAEPLTSEQMGYMTLSDYGYYVATLGIMCGVAFVLGVKW